MRIYKPQTWLVLDTLLSVAFIVVSICSPPLAAAQDSGTPTHPPPPPTRTLPPGPRVTPTVTPTAMPTSAPALTSAPGAQPTASPTPEASPVMPETGAVGPGGISALVLILGVCVLGWGLLNARRSGSVS